MPRKWENSVKSEKTGMSGVGVFVLFLAVIIGWEDRLCVSSRTLNPSQLNIIIHIYTHNNTLKLNTE